MSTEYIQKTILHRGIAARIVMRGSKGTVTNFLLVDYFTASCHKGQDPEKALEGQERVVRPRDVKQLRLVWNGETWVSTNSKPLPKSIKMALDSLTPAENVSMLEGLTAHETIEILADLSNA